MSLLEELYGLKGRTALVTGGGTGIGRMVAEALAAAGASVLIASRKSEACEVAAEEINTRFGPGSAQGFAGDVGSEEGVAALAASVRERVEGLHILINNAGKAWMADSLDSFPYRGWESVLRVNVTGPFALTQRLLPMLEGVATSDAPSRVVNIGSMVGTLPMGNNAYSYAASKGALHHLTRILAQELAPRHILVNAIAPGPFPTQMTSWATGSEGSRKAMAAGVPLGRWGRASDLAGLSLYLCGAGGGYTTGAVIPLDGGVSVAAGPDLLNLEHGPR